MIFLKTEAIKSKLIRLKSILTLQKTNKQASIGKQTSLNAQTNKKQITHQPVTTLSGRQKNTEPKLGIFKR
ncbi:hypothetical protein [Shewanella sp. ENK2]|uniref:hypothetical protein n=1 Tax=Shewanella sp. ENK2 TaxID=2775245 RepID=UPI003747965B